MTPAPQHAALAVERWAQFSFEDQILMIGNEMNRASRLLELQEWDHLRRCYQRVLQLVDLTVTTTNSRSRRREALRWRELLAALYIGDHPSLEAHEALFRCLLRFTPATSSQIPVLFPGDAAREPARPPEV